jgi:hypothetical protein
MHANLCPKAVPCRKQFIFERYFRIVFRKGAEIHIQTEIGFAGEAIVTDVMFIRLNKLPLQQMKF